MSRYQLTPAVNGVAAVDTTKAHFHPVASITAATVGASAQEFREFVEHLAKLLAAPAQFEVTQRLMSDEEFCQVQALRAKRKAIQSELHTVAVEKKLEVRIGCFPKPELGEAAVRGVLNKLMDDLAHNGNAIRKLGVEPAPIDTALAEAVEAQLAVITSAE
jgi:hypothetical protein